MLPVTAFALTMLIEWPIFAWMSGQGFRRTGLFCLCLNGATWGAAMGILALFNLPIVLVEIAIIIAEAALIAWFWEWPAGRAARLSLAMNLTSWLLGTPLLAALYRR